MSFEKTIGYYYLIQMILFVVFIIILPWDLLAWLTGNQDTWKNTGFRGPIILFSIMVVMAIFAGIINAIAHGVGSVKQKLQGKTDGAGMPPSDPSERHKWANRLPPYDK